MGIFVRRLSKASDEWLNRCKKISQFLLIFEWPNGDVVKGRISFSPPSAWITCEAKQPLSGPLLN